MYALKRIMAYVIDMALVGIPVQYYSADLSFWMERFVSLPDILNSYAWMVQSAIPIVLLGTLVGLFGKTPGKLLMFLKVVNSSHRSPGIAQGLLREIIKLACGMFFFGALYALYGIVTSGKAFYDDWLSLDVDDERPTGLTDRQKKWREFSKSNRSA